MEMYGRNQAMNGGGGGGTQSVQGHEWSPGDADTGHEESMWRLGLGGENYPERTGAPDCAYYMRTGVCGYGNRCRYNHPRDRATGHRILAEIHGRENVAKYENLLLEGSTIILQYFKLMFEI